MYKNWNSKHLSRLQQVTGIPIERLKPVSDWLVSGAGIPFVARYRKEVSGGMTEVDLEALHKAMLSVCSLEALRQTILKRMAAISGMDSDQLKAVEHAESEEALNDLWAPFRTTRRKRFDEAKENGIFALSHLLRKSAEDAWTLRSSDWRKHLKRPFSDNDALEEALYVNAFELGHLPQGRTLWRQHLLQRGKISFRVVKGKEEDLRKMGDFHHAEVLGSKIAAHRLMALLRAERLGYLRLTVKVDADFQETFPKRMLVMERWTHSSHNLKAARVALRQYVHDAAEKMCRGDWEKKAQEAAIEVFAQNLRQVLMTPPIQAVPVLALDPGFKTGCKLVVLDATGNLIYNETIFPHSGNTLRKTAEGKVKRLCEIHRVKAIGVGNGTAGRETMEWLDRLHLPVDVLTLVNESGASIYSASALGREEFPNHDITVRGAISIGRRLLDPLAEWVKLDPATIGIGQYQHDVPPNGLKERLEQTVTSCVNEVGVRVNTASKHLLKYVSGIGESCAARIVEYRTKYGPFQTRQELLHVPRFGEQTFLHSAGFLRIEDGLQPLDSTAVHPESYAWIGAMAANMNATIEELMKDAERLDELIWEKNSNAHFGEETFNLIKEELSKRGRDRRERFVRPAFDHRIRKLDDVKEGMILVGMVSNITAFGCFVDVGIHQDGLVHISEFANGFVHDPHQIVVLQQVVRVKVLGVDLARRRLQLSIRQALQNDA